MSIKARISRAERDARARVLSCVMDSTPEQMDAMLAEIIEQRARQAEGKHAEHLRLFDQWRKRTRHQHPETLVIARAVWHGPLDDEQLEIIKPN